MDDTRNMKKLEQHYTDELIKARNAEYLQDLKREDAIEELEQSLREEQEKDALYRARLDGAWA